MFVCRKAGKVSQYEVCAIGWDGKQFGVQFAQRWILLLTTFRSALGFSNPLVQCVNVKPTTYVHLVPKLRICGAVPLLAIRFLGVMLNWAEWPLYVSVIYWETRRLLSTVQEELKSVVQLSTRIQRRRLRICISQCSSCLFVVDVSHIFIFFPPSQCVNCCCKEEY
jgi:hypothetical protein